MNTTSSVSHIIQDYRTIVTKEINPIVAIVAPNSKLIVDILLNDCSDLIDQRYKNWFAKRFYKFDKDTVLSAASVARNDTGNSQKHFAHLIKTSAGGTHNESK